jgi:hypothetical protein
MRPLTCCLALFFLLISVPVQAQFRSSLRQADKEYELHAYNSAIESYQQALARRDDDLEALSRIADCYRMLNKMSQANQYYTKAVKDRKVSDKTRLEHAHVLRALGRYDEAKQWYLYYAQEADPVVGNHFAKSCDFAKQQIGQSSIYVAASSPANSPTADFGPSFAGRDQVIFSSFRTDKGGAFNGQAQNVPLVASFGPSGVLQEPFLLQSGFTGGNIGPVSYSGDGSMVLFTRNNFTDGTRMIPEAGIQLTQWIAEVNPSGQWVNARPMAFNSSDHSSGFGVFSPNGQEIYFASNREGGYGGFDIYRATRTGTGWSLIPENLGTVINSVGNEITPSYDGLNLYFSSDWHYGMGGYDVFRTELQNGRPSTLLHMGDNINSSRDDYSFIYDASRLVGYVVSNRIGGRGNEDIYRINQASESLVLAVRSASDGTPVSGAVIDLTACGDQAYLTDINGRYSFRAVAGTNCEVTVSKEGFLPTNISLSSITASSGEVQVMLSKENEAFQGRIVDASTRLSIPGALVRVIDRASGNVAEVRTDAQGGYAIAMQPFKTYDISIASPGYETLSFPLGMADGSNRNVLGVLSLLPNQNFSGNDGTNPPATVSSGYAVQMAALSKAPDMGQFAQLSDLGQVYSVNEGGTYKVRMGIFQTRAEAEAAKAALAGRGYPKTFIVTDSGNGVQGSQPVPESNPGQPMNPSTGTSGPYYVQLGAYTTPKFFNSAKAQQIGTLVQRQRGNLTLMLLSARSPAEAQQLKATALANGFAGAFLVQEVNGQLQKM